jgi:hypothetical protein
MSYRFIEKKLRWSPKRSTQVCQIFHVTMYQKGKYILNDHKEPKYIPNGRIKYIIAIKSTNILYSKALQNLPKTGIFGKKTYHLATLLSWIFCWLWGLMHKSVSLSPATVLGKSCSWGLPKDV